MKPVVITGARGYIGSALVRRLAGEGCALRLVSRSIVVPTGTTNAAIDHIRADLRDTAGWSALLADAKAVVHLSSRTDLRAAEADPVGDDDINIEPFARLCRPRAVPQRRSP